MRGINPETGRPTRTAVAAYAAALGVLGVSAYAVADRLDRPAACTQDNGCAPEAAQTPDVAEPTPTDPETSPAPNRAQPQSAAPKPTPSPSKKTRTPQKQRKTTPPATSVTLDPDTCGDWTPKHPQPLMVQGGKARVVVDTRAKDGCEPGFYSGATVYEKDSSESKKVDLGVSFTTMGSIALNGSVLTIRDYGHGQEQTISTPHGDLSSDIWLNVAFANGETGNISAVDVGFPSQATLEKYVG